MKHGHHTQTGSGVVVKHPAMICCVIVSVATNADYAEFYNGHDATSGSKLFKVKALANRSVTFNLTHGFPCEKGIYVNCSETSVEWTVFFKSYDPEDDLCP